jgi:hypothetical protein
VKTAVIYAYYETPQSVVNLEFFAEVGMAPHDDVIFVVIINGRHCSIRLPRYKGCIILERDNVGFDFGAHRQGLLTLSERFGTTVESLPFDNFVFLNSSVIGPFLPSYFPQGQHWTTVLTSRLNEQVKLAGPSIVCLPRTDAGGYGPKVEGYCFATDLTGLGILWRDARVFMDHATKFGCIVDGEYGMSRAVLGGGFSLDCLLYKYQGMDWSDPANWDQNDNAPPSRLDTYDGISIHPFEVVFHKWYWSHHPTQLVAYEYMEKYRRWKLERVRRTGRRSG